MTPHEQNELLTRTGPGTPRCTKIEVADIAGPPRPQRKPDHP